MSTQPSAASPTAHALANAFAEDVEYYLSLTPRQLPSRYLYDDLGSALFDAICRLPWYRIERTERQLLSAHGRDILARVGPLATLVELGPGSGEKLATLVDACGLDSGLTVHLVDVSPSALQTAARALGGWPDLTVVSHQTTYEDGLSEFQQREPVSGRTLALFLGSNIGNFDPPGAAVFLRKIRAALSAGDTLLLGADLVRPEADLLLAYDDPLGITAAFNRNLLVRANRELGADFDLDGFVHRAVWNATASRVEMHLVSVRRQRVRIPASSLDVTFEIDETIWTESSYKYHRSDVLKMLAGAGFRGVGQWVDDRFSLTLAEAMPHEP